MSIQRFNKRHNFDTDLFRSGVRLVGLITDFEITAPSHIQISGYVNIRHKGTIDGPIGISSRIGYRRETSWANLYDTHLYPTGSVPQQWSTPGFTWVPGAKDGSNIRDLRDHYGTLMLMGDIILNTPGIYRFEPYLFEHSAIDPDNDGLSCVNTDTGQTDEDTFGYMATTVTSIG